MLGAAIPKLRGSWNRDAPQIHQDFCSQVPVPCPVCVCECDSVCVTLPSALPDERSRNRLRQLPSFCALKAKEQLCHPQFLEKPSPAWWAAPTASSTPSSHCSSSSSVPSMAQPRLLCSQRCSVMGLHPHSNKLDSKPITPPECIFLCL